MRTIKFFFASSMAEEQARGLANEVTDTANDYYRQLNIEFEAIIYGVKSPHLPATTDTQGAINNLIKDCEVFIMMFRISSERIGEITLQEYCEALKLSPLPNIKILCLDDKKVAYGDKIKNFEQQIADYQSHNSLEADIYINKIDDENALCKAIASTLIDSATKTRYYRQNQLSYEAIQRAATFDNYRLGETEVKFFERPIDREISQKVGADSSLIILRGNTLAGKTRSAIELMKSRAEWQDYKFYVFNNRAQLDALQRFEFLGDVPFVVFIDDINNLIANNQGGYNGDRLGNFTGVLNDFVARDGRATPRVHLIIVITEREKNIQLHDLWTCLFGADYANSNFKNHVIDFNKYSDKIEQRKLVRLLRAEGYKINLPTNSSGNFAIGSLFYDEARIERVINEMPQKAKLLLHAIKCQRLYKHTNFGDKNGLRDLFRFLDDSYLEGEFNTLLESLNHSALIEYITGESRFQADSYLIERLFPFRTNESEAIEDILNYESSLNNIYMAGFKLLVRGNLNRVRLLALGNYINQQREGVMGASPLRYFVGATDVSELRFCSAWISRFPTLSLAFRDHAARAKDQDKSLYIALTSGLLLRNDLSKGQLERLLQNVFTTDGDKITISDTFKEQFNDVDFLNSIIRYLPVAYSLNCVKKIDLPRNVELDMFAEEEEEDNGTIDNDGVNKLMMLMTKIFNATKSYDEFCYLFKEIGNDDLLKQLLTEGRFIQKLINQLLTIARRYSQTDITTFCDDLINNPDGKYDVLKYEENKNILINSITPMFQYLQQDRAKRLFRTAVEKGYYNSFLLSYLCKNENLFFDDLLDIFTTAYETNTQNINTTQHGYDTEKLIHLISLNQLLDNAQTSTDAKDCLKLIHQSGYIETAEAMAIKDNFTLASYIKTLKNWDDIISLFRTFDREGTRTRTLQHDTIGILVNKLSFAGAYDLIFGEYNEDDLFQTWGLTTQEQRESRKNPIILNLLICKNSYQQQREKNGSQVYEVFNRTVEEHPEIVLSDDEVDNNKTILNALLRYKSTYEQAKDFITQSEEQVRESNRRRENPAIVAFRYNHYTYSSLLYIITSVDNTLDIATKIDHTNELLMRAHTQFYEQTSVDKFRSIMSEIYHMRLKLLTYTDFEQKHKFTLEGKEPSMALPLDYAKKLFDNGYGHPTIIYTLFEALKQAPNESQWDNYWTQIINLARDNGIKLQFESASKLTQKGERWLIKLNEKDGTLKYKESAIIAAESKMKIVCYLLETGQWGYLQAENYVNTHNIIRTKTYWNVLLKNATKELKNKGTKQADREFIKTSALQMLDQIDKQERTIQQFLAVVICKNSLQEALQFKNDEFPNVENSVEVITAILKESSSLEAKKAYLTDVLRNGGNANIRTLNAILYAYVECYKHFGKPLSHVQTTLSKTELEQILNRFVVECQATEKFPTEILIAELSNFPQIHNLDIDNSTKKYIQDYQDRAQMYQLREAENELIEAERSLRELLKKQNPHYDKHQLESHKICIARIYQDETQKNRINSAARETPVYFPQDQTIRFNNKFLFFYQLLQGLPGYDESIASRLNQDEIARIERVMSMRE